MDFDGKKVCGVADHLGGGDCLWPFRSVSIFADGKLGDVALPEAVEQAAAGWNKICGLSLALTPNAKTAHIVITRGQIDGPSGTLGWSELPCGFTPGQWRQLQQKYDSGELWAVSENPPGGRIDAVRVICHELGHAIGISHINDGNLMAPTYSSRIRWPQRGDVAEAVMRYGKVPEVSQPPRPTDPPTPGEPAKPDDAVWSRLFPCLVKYGVDIFSALSAEERKALILAGIGLWRRLSIEERSTLQRLIDEPKA